MKTDTRQPVEKVKPTDKMVMMPGLFDGTKPEMSKQHYERFNLYINFQTKSDHFTDPVKRLLTFSNIPWTRWHLYGFKPIDLNLQILLH